MLQVGIHLYEMYAHPAMMKGFVMEYLIMAAALAVFVLVIFAVEGHRARIEKKRFIQYLYTDYGKLIEKKYELERFVRIGSFFERHPVEGQIDDITWNDLGMDDIFKRMNYTLSSSGEEYLYYTLRTLKQNEEELLHLEEVIQYFAEHADERVKIQLLAKELGHTGKFSLYDYLDNLNELGYRSNKKHIICNLLFIPLIIALFFPDVFSVGILGIVLLTIYNIISYFKDKGEIDPYITSFSYIMRLKKVCEEIQKISVTPCETEWKQLKDATKCLKSMSRNSYWIMSPFRNNSNGNIFEMLLDYIRMVFHFDLMKFNSMLHFVREHLSEVDSLIQVVGYLETAIAIFSFRDSLEHGWCKPIFSKEQGIFLEEAYHPMLTSPVKNGIATEKGVLLTGSNASGKSTFLKTVALNAIFSQTIHTCTAEGYRAPIFYVYSSMSLRDNIESGESYYIVEIKALKRILDATENVKAPVLCFVDEVLRGTNTVERIAASAQILESLSVSGILCFAATHDIELTELLKDDYNNYHFEEDVRDGDVFFNYKLQRGKATTRNAIKLLELIGYDKDMIQKATARAENFLKSGLWE